MRITDFGRESTKRSNRTFMELKYVVSQRPANVKNRSNRTFMELK